MPTYQCAALNNTGTRCRAPSVESTGWWRCERHAHWYDTASPAEIEQLALMEILETIDTLEEVVDEDLDTRR